MRARLTALLRSPTTHHLLFLLGLWLLFFWRYFAAPPNQVVFPDGDFTQQFFVFRDLAYRQLVAGHLPLWTDCFYGGYPFHADPQSQLFYPPVWLSFAVLRLQGWGHFPLMALTIEALAHYLLIAVFAYFFLREESGSAPAGLIGAIALTWGGYLTGYPPLQTGILETVTWLPAILLVLRRLAEQYDWRWGALAALLLGVAFFAGHPQSFMYVVYLSSAYFLLRARLAGRSWFWALVRLALVVAAVGLLGAVQFLPQAQFLLLSTRAELGFDALAGGLGLGDVVQVVVTQLVSRWHPLNAGILGVTLATVAVISQRRQPVVVFWAAVAVFGLLLSFGGKTPVYHLAYRLVPGFALFRGQERAALWWAMALSALIAFGAAWVLAGDRDLSGVRRWLRNLTPLALLLLVGSHFAAQSGLGDWGHLPPRFGLLLLGLLGALLALSVRWQRQWLLAGLLGLELFALNASTNTVAPFETYPYTPLLDVIQGDAATGRWFRVQDDARMQGHWACGYGLSEWGGITPIRLASWEAFDQQTPELVRWDLLGIDYVISWKADLITRENVWLPAERVYEGTAPLGEATVYRLGEQRPPAWLVRETTVTGDEAALWAALQEPGFDAYTAAVVVEPVPALSAGDVTVTGMRYGAWSFDVRLAGPGLLVMSQAWYPGWQADVDGAEVMQVDGYAIGVLLPAGDYSLTVSYRPVLLMVGGGISAATLVALIALMVIGRRRVRA